MTETPPACFEGNSQLQMSTAAVLVARIRSRERVMSNIVERNPESYRENPYYTQLQGAVVAYRDALTQLERIASVEEQVVLA
jgi:hypothetical protein